MTQRSVCVCLKMGKCSNGDDLVGRGDGRSREKERALCGAMFLSYQEGLGPQSQ